MNVRMTVATFSLTGAIFDDARVYRYRLWRVWDAAAPRILWVMLNPSTADEHVLDPTLRRCRDYSRAWGFGSFEVVNLFAWRSTDPDVLPSLADPVGPENDARILEAAAAAARVIVGWGKPGRLGGRDRHVAGLLLAAGARLECLGVNGNGTPKHPLYLKKTLIPEPWTVAAC